MSTRIVNTHEAKSRLSELIREAEQGTEVIVARNGRPVAKLIPWPPHRVARAPGAWVGQVTIDGDIVGPDAEVDDVFERSAAGRP